MFITKISISHINYFTFSFFVDVVSVPNVLRVSPFDVGVTRRVKHAYSTLDAISMRTGIVLRRYPFARVFVFSYMVSFFLKRMPNMGLCFLFYNSLLTLLDWINRNFKTISCWYFHNKKYKFQWTHYIKNSG